MRVENSARLTFELMDEADKQYLFELDQDPEVMRYINGGKIPSMDDVENVFIPRMMSYRNPEAGWGLWKVCRVDSQAFIGWILIRPMEFFSDNPEYDNLEIGWRFKQSSWGKGYATEAASAIMKGVQTRDEVNKISAVAMEDNLGSINIMKKLGLSYLKTYTHQDPLGDLKVVYYQRQV